MVLLGAAVLFGVVRRAPPVGSDPRITTVTALPGLEQFPSISPDGNFVAFSWTGSDPAGVPDIWIKAIDSDDLRQLTDTRTAEFRPAWSPDGREIAFLRAGEGVVIASALSGQERKVATSGSIVGWTPDGRSLLVRDRTGDKPVRDLQARARLWDAIPADSSSERRRRLDVRRVAGRQDACLCPLRAARGLRPLHHAPRGRHCSTPNRLERHNQRPGLDAGRAPDPVFR